jgi:TolA-binding protein
VDKKYDQAIKYYDFAIKLNQPMKDYAMFQKGICYGLKEDYTRKISVLKQLLSEQTGTKYTADTKFELAKTFLNTDQLSEAESYYNNVIDNHFTSPYVKYCLVDLCLIQFKKGNDAGVIALWKRLIKDYPNDPVLADALVVAQSVLIENGEDASIPEDLMNRQEIEQQAFSIAEGYVVDGDCDQAIERLSAYLTKYEPAVYGVNANYYLGKCYLTKNRKPEALNDQF